MEDGKDISENNKITRSIIVILVVAAIYTVILLLFKMYNTTYFEISISLTPFFAFLATLILVVVTWWYAKITESIASSSKKNLETMEGTMMHQVILQIQGTFSSSEMGEAVHSLWDFYDECERKVKNENKKKIIEDENFRKKIEKKMLDTFQAGYNQDEVKFKKLIGRSLTTNTGVKFNIDSQRRKVSYFFQYLYDTYKVNPKFKEYIKQFFWRESDEQTVKFILIPLEKKLVNMINEKKRIGIPLLDEKKYAVFKLEELCIELSKT
jgi:sulfur relay (sulfurtransferase) DsrC/TusE family protein